MKRLIVFSLSVILIISLFSFSVFAAPVESQYGDALDFMKGNEPAYFEEYQDAFVPQGQSKIFSYLRVSSFRFLDTSTNESLKNPVYIRYSKDNQEVYSSLALPYRHDISILMASELYYFPYSPAAMLSFDVNFRLRLSSTADSVTAISRFYFKDGSYTDFRYSVWEDMSVNGLYQGGFLSAGIADSPDISNYGSLKIPADAVAFRFFFDINIDNAAAYDYLEVTQFSTTFDIEYSSLTLSSFINTGSYGSDFDEFGNEIINNQDVNTDKIVDAVVDSIGGIIGVIGGVTEELVIPDNDAIIEDVEHIENSILGDILGDFILGDKEVSAPDLLPSYMDGAIRFFTELTPALLAVVSLLNLIFGIDWLMGVIMVSLSLGLLAAVLNISIGIFGSIQAEQEAISREKARVAREDHRKAYEYYRSNRARNESYSARYKAEKEGHR